MPPQYVKPYVKTHKNDAVDAAAICEAVTRPTMRFVAVKSEEQQALLALHRVRQSFVKDRTAHSNQIRGELAEFGLIVPVGLSALRKRVPTLLEDPLLPNAFGQLIQRLLDEVLHLDEQIKLLERDIVLWHRSSELSRRLAQIPGIGPLTASALLCSIGDISYFKNARQLPAWLGLVPRQHSSGGRNTLLGITQARGLLLAHPAHSRCALGYPCCTAKRTIPRAAKLAAQIARSCSPQYRRCCLGQQECPHSLGVVGQAPGLQARV